MEKNYRIYFGDVKIGDIAKKNINDCLQENWVTAGKKVREFETGFAKACQSKYACMVNSGTTADFLACLALYDLGAKRGQKIITPALNFIATQNSVIAAGFIPVPVDIKRETLNINEDLIEEKIDKDTVAIMCVNTMGKPCNMRKLKNLCDKHDLTLICDNCESHFCEFEGKQMSHWSDMDTYSFFSAHLIFSVQSGAITSNREGIADCVFSSRNHGRGKDEILFHHRRFGWNGNSTDIHASIGLENLANYQKIFDIRKTNLNYMLSELKNRELDNIFHFNLEEENDKTSPHALSLTFKDDNEERFLKFHDYMDNKGIQVKLNFKSVFTQQKSMEYFSYKQGDFPEAEFVGRNGLHLACHQFLTKDDMDYIVETVETFVKK